MRLVPGILLALFTASFSYGQQTFAIKDPDLVIKEAVQLFQQDKFDLACPLFRGLQQSIQARPSVNLSLTEQEISFYAICCGLKQAEPLAEKEALQFVHYASFQPLRDRMHFQLGDYYFRTHQWANSIDQYTEAGVANLSNTEIASLQFQQGYAAFVLQRYKEAKPLLNSVRSLPEDPHQLPATYYYGLLSFRERNWDEAKTCFQRVETDSRYAGLVPYYIAQIMLINGERDPVISYLEQKLENKSILQQHALEMKQLLGHAYFSGKNYTRALPLLREYVAKAEKITRQDLYELSYCSYREGNWKESVAGFKQLAEGRDSLGQHAMYLLGDANLKLGDKSGARNAFLFCAINNSDPTLRENARFFHAKLSYESGYFDEALKGFQQFIRDYSGSTFITEAKELLIGVLAATSNYKEALVLLENTERPSEQTRKLLPGILYGRAVELIHDEKPNDALPLLDKALADINNIAILPLLHFWKGELSFRKGNYELAAGHFRSYIELGAPAAGEADILRARYNLGYSFLRLSQFAKAVPHFEWVSTQGNAAPSMVLQDAILRLADCQFMLRNYSAARINYERVVSSGWVSADYATFQLASLTGIQKPAGKIALLKGMEEKYPSSSLIADSWMEIADTYMADEKYREAIPYLDKIITDGREAVMLPAAYFKSGIAHYNSDDNDKALYQFQQLMDKFPNTPEAADALDNVKSIYVESGRSADYISYLKKKGIPLSISTEDSLNFIAAELLYNNKKWEESKVALNSYTEKFPLGAYILDVRFMLAELSNAQKQWVTALSNYEAVLLQAPNRFAEAASLAAARIYFFELKNYDSACAKYTMQLQLSNRPENKLEALRGCLRSYYLLQNWEAASRVSDQLLLEKNISSDDRSLAAMSRARLLLQQGKEAEAQAQCKLIVQQNKAALGAEARYEIAASLFRQQQWKAAEKAAFETINRSGSYEQWVTRSYLLLGDIYFEQKDYFNARATYSSVLENASQEPWKKEAQAKLEQVNKAESASGKIE